MPLRRPPAPPLRAASRRTLARAGLALAAAVVAALPSVAASGCSETSQPTTNIGPTGTPAIVITSPETSACFPIGSNPDAHIPVQISVENFLLRPPGTCSSAVQCGEVQLLVNGVVNNEGSGPIVDVLVRKLADRFATLQVTARLVDEAGKPFMSGTKDFASTVTIVTAATCPDGGAGGGGGGGAGGAGGAGAATTGAGGATTTGAGVGGAGGATTASTTATGAGGAGGAGG